jgi:Cu2+-exporting ATPase
MLQATTGQGVEGRIAGRRLRLGRPDFAGAGHGLPMPPAIRPSDRRRRYTAVALADAQGWLACFSLGDVLREEAGELVRRLQALGCRVSLLSGDGESAVRQAAVAAGIAEARGSLSPQDKHDHLQALQRAGAVVAMVTYNYKVVRQFAIMTVCGASSACWSASSSPRSSPGRR